MRLAKSMMLFIEVSALISAVLIVLALGTAKADHIPLGSASPLTFACESADSLIRLIEAKDDTEANAILVGAKCFKFTGIPARALKYIGTYSDPMQGSKLFEVYEVETPDGATFYTAALPQSDVI